MKHAAMVFPILLISQISAAAWAGDPSSQTNFQDWNSVAASCEGSDAAIDVELCGSIAKEAEYLARAARVPFAYLGYKATYPDRIKAAGEAGLENPLHMKIFLATNQENTSIYGEITAGDYYQDTANKAGPARLARKSPKSGEFLIWKKGSLFSGKSEELRRTTRFHLGEYIKTVMLLYIETRAEANSGKCSESSNSGQWHASQLSMTE